MKSKITTIHALLRTELVRHNQTYLTQLLGVNRGTVRKYMHDEGGLHHEVKITDDGYEVFINISNKPSK